MRLKKSILMSCLFVFANLILCGQNFSEDLKRIKEFRSVSDYSFHFTSSSEYQSAGIDTTIVTQGNQWKCGDNWGTKQGDMEVICEDKLMLIINHKNKIVQVRKRSSADLEGSWLSSFDQLNQSGDSIVFIGTKNSVNTYEIYPKEGKITKMSFSVDSKGRIHDFEYISAQGGRLVSKIKLLYDQPKLQCRGSFAMEDVLQGKGEKCRLVGAIKDYQLINNIN